MTLRIVSTALLSFLCYLTIGLQLAVVPGFVHTDLGFNAILAGLAVSVQYVATLASRPLVGRLADASGAKRTTGAGLVICAAGGLVLAVAAALHAHPGISLGVLIASRLLLGVAESCVATGATLWGIGRTGARATAQVISWNGIATYGGLAVGAPCGLWIAQHGWFALASMPPAALASHGAGLASRATDVAARADLVSIGLASLLVALAGAAWAAPIGAVATVAGETLALRRVLRHVLPYGLGLALGGVGFGTIASFVTLYYASRQWPNAGLTLSIFGACFIVARLLFADTINRWGGFRVAIVSLACECAGLLLLWLAWTPAVAFAAAGLTGFGFSLVFPALGVEAVRRVPAHGRGSALGLYTAFVDLSLGISGPVAGMIVSTLGYPPIFLFAAVMAMAGTTLTVALMRRRAADAPADSETHADVDVQGAQAAAAGGRTPLGPRVAA